MKNLVSVYELNTVAFLHRHERRANTVFDHFHPMQSGTPAYHPLTLIRNQRHRHSMCQRPCVRFEQALVIHVDRTAHLGGIRTGQTGKYCSQA